MNIIRDAPAPSAIKTTRDQDEITPPTETIVKEQPSAYATRAWTPMPLPKTEEVITPPIQTMLKDQPSAYETGASSPLPLSTANTSLAPSFSPLTHTETVTKDWPVLRHRFRVGQRRKRGRKTCIRGRQWQWRRCACLICGWLVFQHRLNRRRDDLFGLWQWHRRPCARRICGRLLFYDRLRRGRDLILITSRFDR